MTEASIVLDEGVLDLEVHGMQVEASGVLSVTLRDPHGFLLPAWEPGAHIDLCLPTRICQYSLCGDPMDRRSYEVAVLREHNSRGGSSYVHERLRPGELVEVGGPRNHFKLVDAPGYVLFAGGIGITPMLSMAAQAERDGRDWHLHYGGRTRSSMAFLQRLSKWGDRVSIVPEDELGLLDIEQIISTAPQAYEIYACGPAAMLDAVTASAASHDRHVHLERFASVAADSFGPRRPFTVVCQRSGLTVKVSGHQTLLESLEAAGIVVPHACRDGVCGSCEIKVVGGRIEHRDSVGYSGSETAMLACVSRALDEELQIDI